MKKIRGERKENNNGMYNDREADKKEESPLLILYSHPTTSLAGTT